MKNFALSLIVAFLFASCASSDKKQDYTPSPATMETSENQEVQQKIDRRMNEIEREMNSKIRLRSLLEK